MIPFNPCGRIVDFLKDEYEVDVHPYRDAPEVGRIRWYKVGDDAPVLPYDSILNTLYQHEQRLWTEDPTRGEVPFTQRVAPPNHPPVQPVGDHVCGTPQDFAEGGLYDPEAVNPPVDRWGIPMCCNPVAVPLGGGVSSGRPESSYSSNRPGGSCADALLWPVNVEFAGHWEPVSPFFSGWWKFNVTPGATMHFTWSNTFGSGSMFILTGPDCSTLEQIGIGGTAGCHDFTVGVYPVVYAQIVWIYGVPIDYTLNVQTGPCP